MVWKRPLFRLSVVYTKIQRPFVFVALSWGWVCRGSGSRSRLFASSRGGRKLEVYRKLVDGAVGIDE